MSNTQLIEALQLWALRTLGLVILAPATREAKEESDPRFADLERELVGTTWSSEQDQT